MEDGDFAPREAICPVAEAGAVVLGKDLGRDEGAAFRGGVVVREVEDHAFVPIPFQGKYWLACSLQFLEQPVGHPFQSGGRVSFFTGLGAVPE